MFFALCRYNEPEPVLLLDPEESYDFDDSGVTDSILDSSQVQYNLWFYHYKTN